MRRQRRRIGQAPEGVKVALLGVVLDVDPKRFAVVLANP
jgi:hypothetical protein